MYNWKKWVCGAACALVLTAVTLPGKALQADPVNNEAQQETKPAFENPQGMTVDLIYYTPAAEGREEIVGRGDRTVIPAGVASVTVEMQQQKLPKGYSLLDPKDLPLEEDTVEVRIPVKPESSESGKPTEPSEKPTEPSEKPTEPSEKPTEPSEKPTEPSEKPTEPSEKPTEPTEKPTKPTEKPTKPTEKPKPKPDPTNPKTGDSYPLGLWLTLGLGSGLTLLWLPVRKKF